MKIRQALLGPVALAVFAALAGAPAGAQNATTSITTSSSSTVSLKGIVSGQPESVSFSGNAAIRSTLARDPDFGRPVLVLTIDLNGVSGVGSSTRAKYVVPSQENVQRHLASSHQVEITFPFMKSGSDGSSARTGVASFALDFDLDTGAVTSATGSVSSPSF